MHVYWVWFAMLPGLSVRQKLALLERYSDPEEIFHAPDAVSTADLPADRKEALSNKDTTEAERIVKLCTRKNIGILPFGAAAYPSRLRNISDPPLVLYYQGVLPDFEERPVVAVVGTRKASAYGLNQARQLSEQIAACGGMVVSGGALGVDTQALQGALAAGGQTVAVLGSGVDVAYPPSNRQLFYKIMDTGCLLSEYPPGTGPKPWQFPERNRILSGMSNGVLVIEAPEKSGALITARDALEQGRDVFVVPGNIDMPTCRGSNGLLQEGAGAVFSGWDAVREYAPQYPNIIQKQEIRQVRTEERTADKKVIDNPASTPYSVIENENSRLTQEECALLACLDSTPRPVDEVVAQSGMAAGVVLSMLTKLALKGVVMNHPGKLVSAKKQQQ